MIGATDNMPTNVIMPALGVAQQTGTLLKWLKTEGDDVAKGEPLMEIETDKATVEIEAPESGILAQVTASPGDQVAVGSRIALILAPGEKPSDLRPSPAASPASAPSRDNRGENTPAVVPSAAREQSSEFVPGRVLASPAAKRMARERGIDLATLKGSGPERSILVRDSRPKRGWKRCQIRLGKSGGELVLHDHCPAVRGEFQKTLVVRD